MSTRGPNFLHKWISANVPETIGADIISVSELADKLFAEAKAIGISSVEIEEETSMRLSITTPPWLIKTMPCNP